MEFAIVSPVLILIVFGIIEYGLLFRDYLTVANTTRTGARVGSAAGSIASADFEILQSLKQAAAALPGGAGAIQTISIFKSSASGGELPSGCQTGSVSGACNVYTSADLTRPITDFGCAGSAPDRFWCPTVRSDVQSAGLDYVGVYIETEHDFLTSMFGSSKSLEDTVVMRLEPKRA